MSDLAIDGGPRAVTALMNDSWQNVSDLEKQYVNQILDNKDDAYAELDKFEDWLATPVAPSAEWVEQTAQAFAKVAAHRARLSEIANRRIDE